MRDIPRTYIGKLEEQDRVIETDTEMYIFTVWGRARIDDMFRPCIKGVTYKITIEPIDTELETVEEALEYIELSLVPA